MCPGQGNVTDIQGRGLETKRYIRQNTLLNAYLVRQKAEGCSYQRPILPSPFSIHMHTAPSKSRVPKHSRAKAQPISSTATFPPSFHPTTSRSQGYNLHIPTSKTLPNTLPLQVPLPYSPPVIPFSHPSPFSPSTTPPVPHTPKN